MRKRAGGWEECSGMKSRGLISQKSHLKVSLSWLANPHWYCFLWMWWPWVQLQVNSSVMGNVPEPQSFSQAQPAASCPGHTPHHRSCLGFVPATPSRTQQLCSVATEGGLKLGTRTWLLNWPLLPAPQSLQQLGGVIRKRKRTPTILSQ